MSRSKDVDDRGAAGTGATNGGAGHGRRKWVLVGVALLAVAGAGVGWWLAASGDGAENGGTRATSSAEVVVTDMERVETLDGTLGFDEGDPITSRLSGTLTAAVEAGTVVKEGDVLFRVDGKPVVLLQGDLPVWQAMGLVEVPLTLRSSGTITWLPEEGSVLEQGDVIAEVNQTPVVLLTGDLPGYRTLQNGSEGADVKQLEAALVALGYDPDGAVTVDEEFTSATRHMVLDWQADIGVTEDGRVDPGDIVFLPGSVTVGVLSVSVGDAAQGSTVIGSVRGAWAGAEGSDVEQLEAALTRLGFSTGPVDGVFTSETETAVLAWQQSVGAETDGVVALGEVVFRPRPIRVSENLLAVGDSVGNGAGVLGASSDQVEVTVALPASEQELLTVGDRVIVVLPDDSEAGGTVTSVASVATRNQTSGEVTFDVLVALDDVAVAAGLDQAPVSVDVVTESRTGVLAVPVTALLALAEGGYAVEVDNGDGTTRLVAADPGLYADNMVEVASDGLKAGDMVVVP
jgi:peptidoglycan hydrolase-like protein with peptidoglycan-binding domain